MRKKENKSIIKHVRFSPEEWAQIDAKLQETNLTFSQFVRQVSFSKSVKSRDPKLRYDLQEIRNDLAKIGANINTVARKANMGNCRNDDLHKCINEASEMIKILDKLRSSLIL